MPDCIVCKTPNCERQAHGDTDAVLNVCPRCGTFALTGTAEAILPGLLNAVPIRRALMSHALRKMQRPNNDHLKPITSDELAVFWSRGRSLTPQEQADNLLLWIGDNQSTSAEYAEQTLRFIAATIGTVNSQNGEPGFDWLHSQLDPKGLYRLVDRLNGRVGLQLTINGWEKYTALKKTNAESRLAFMAMKFDQPELNRVIDECFRPAVAHAGFELRLLTDRQPAGVIDDQIRAAILASRFVISDLTHGSPGAYWEAGYGEGLGLPVFYTCERSAWEEKQTHFDTNHLLTIIWDPDELDKAGTQLTAAIRATLRDQAKQSDS
jgi:hypothetical protein